MILIEPSLNAHLRFTDISPKVSKRMRQHGALQITGGGGTQHQRTQTASLVTACFINNLLQQIPAGEVHPQQCLAKKYMVPQNNARKSGTHPDTNTAYVRSAKTR